MPDLSYNLLSVSKAAKAGKVVKFTETGCEILDSNKKVIAVATRVESLYHLNCQAHNEQTNAAVNKSKETKEDTWHRRYGHLGVRNLQKLAKEKLVDDFDFNVSRETTFCESCVEGKHHRSRFPVDGGKRSSEPLGLVHSDVCGKMNATSLSGGEYFLTFIDDNTRFTWIYVLNHKDEIFPCFLEWKAQVERSTGRKLKTLRTDNGGEYVSADFEKCLKKEGVRHELTVPKTPEKNGVDERMKRTLVEAVRSMLADARLPHRFWAEAPSTAVYLRNRSPTTVVEGKTPFEAWTGQKPNEGHLRVFGCAAYAHVAKDERQKLNAKSRKCVLLGYGTERKGYRLYDPRRERIFYSRDAVFDESSRGIEKEQSVPERNSERCVELDFHDDEKHVADKEHTTEEGAGPVL